MKTIFLLLSFFLLASNGLANPGISDALIKEIRQRPSSLIVDFDKKFVDRCEDGGEWAVLSNSESALNKQYISLLLTAAAAGKTVTVTSDGCSYHNKIQSVYVKF